MNGDFLRAKAGEIVDAAGNKIVLRGINLGCWLNMEGYILGGRNIPEKKFKRVFSRINGLQETREFTRLFRDNFVREDDFRNIQDMGFNCVRLPFNYRLALSAAGVSYLKKAIAWCRKYGLWAILDLHAAPGSQNPDWHADSEGEVLLWKERRYQNKFIAVWERLAGIFKEETVIAGYDILNEAVTPNHSAVRRLYKETTAAIRKIDTNHMVFLEGFPWGQDMESIGPPWDDNLVYSIHFYMPVEFTFGFMKGLRYPGDINGKHWSKKELSAFLQSCYDLKKKWAVPLFVGEFGQNSRCPYCHQEFQWLKDTVDLFTRFGLHWTYWTYKAVGHHIYPDGLYQYLNSPPWVGREKPVSGWENYWHLWKKYKRSIVESWKTEHFVQNKSVADILTAAVHTLP
jgi:endoglucanase